jgi:hypothetical protein
MSNLHVTEYGAVANSRQANGVHLYLRVGMFGSPDHV